ncbi:MAG: ABC transporter ATP-binding protein [Acetobacteraceae bacterium]
MAELRVDGLTKLFGAVRAVDNISFTVGDGEFLTLLGPSGCGKSTTLAALAGLDRSDTGRIVLGDEVFFDGARNLFVPPERREVGLVFQSYALWPHMTVAENLDFPLRLRKMPKAQRAERIAEALSLVEMTEYGARYPFALSGGQQQRVALARTLVYRPQLLLLDEPLSNLDAKLRERARSWLRHLQRTLKVTTVYVTHDQAEALALSDRIAVMNGGKIAQLADPHTIYERPADPFVADFIGSSNFFPGVVAEGGAGTVRVGLTQFGAAPPLLTSSPRELRPGDTVTVAVRPERIRIGTKLAGDVNTYPVRIVESTYMGARNQILVRAGQQEFRVEAEGGPEEGTAMVQIPSEACIVFKAPA